MDPLFTFINDLQPLGLAGLLAIVIYQMVKGRGQMTTLTDNHLHDLPPMRESLETLKTSSIQQELLLRSVVESSQRQEGKLTEIVTVLRERK